MPLIETTGDLITFCLRTAGINGIGQTPMAEDSNTGLQLLSNICAEWQRKRWLVYTLVDTALLSTGAQTYSVGVNGAFPIPRPEKIDRAFARMNPAAVSLPPLLLMPTSPVGLAAGTYWNNGGVVCVIDGGPLPLSPAGLTHGEYWQNQGVVCVAPGSTLPVRPMGLVNGTLWNNGGVLCGVTGSTVPMPQPPVPANALDFPLGIFDSYEDFAAVRLKGLSTFPGGVFYESSWPMGVLHFWPIPAAGMFELHILTKTSLPIYSTLTDPINLPPEYMSALTYSLAVELAMNFGLDPKPSLAAKMRAALNTVRVANTQIGQSPMPAAVLPHRSGSGVAAGSSPGFQSGWMT